MTIEKEDNGDSSVNNSFEEVLEGLDNLEKDNERMTRQKAEDNYKIWAFYFNQLKQQFGEVWDLFGKIEQKVQGWNRFRGPNYGQWRFMGASGCGYNFSAGIEYNGSNRIIKRISISYGCLSSGIVGNGIGDERMIGRISELDDKLVGLENCENRSANWLLHCSESMLESLYAHSLQVKAYSGDKFNAEGEVGVEYLQDHNLAKMCSELFLGINRDEITQLSKYFPTPKNNGKDIIIR